MPGMFGCSWLLLNIRIFKKFSAAEGQFYLYSTEFGLCIMLGEKISSVLFKEDLQCHFSFSD
jgi:hypothetical protein